MGTNFSEVLSVLAHELRSPLSVLQGYIRLLQRKREPADPESAMLNAMLAATTRLAALGRQSSELAAWMRREDTWVTTDAAALMQVVTAHAPAGVRILPVAESVAPVALRVADPQALAQAIAALAELVMRETRQTAAAIALRHDDDGTLRLLIAVAAEAATLEGGGSLPASTEPVPFNGGGLGLALSLAAYVLASHGATATTTPDLAHVEVRLVPGSTPA
jgi:signal transduction histidine kinase